MSDKLAAERVARLRKLAVDYRMVVNRFGEAGDVNEMRSAAAEMKAITDEIAALVKDIIKTK